MWKFMYIHVRAWRVHVYCMYLCLNSTVCSWTTIGIACASWSREYIVHKSSFITHVHVHFTCWSMHACTSTCTLYMYLIHTVIQFHKAIPIQFLWNQFLNSKFLINFKYMQYKTLDKGQKTEELLFSCTIRQGHPWVLWQPILSMHSAYS